MHTHMICLHTLDLNRCASSVSSILTSLKSAISLENSYSSQQGSVLSPSIYLTSTSGTEFISKVQNVTLI